MKSILETIQDLALTFARSKGFRPFDHELELDMHMPWSFREELHMAFSNMANVIISHGAETEEMLTVMKTGQLKFTTLRLPQNIRINLFEGEDFIIRLTKKPDPSQLRIEYPDAEGGRVVQMFPEKTAA